MLSYKYTARNPKTGEKVESTISAESQVAAAKLIQQQGLLPVEIDSAEKNSGLFSNFKNKIKTKDRILFARQLSTLINAGMPLVQSLRSVMNQTTSKPLKVIISQTITSVEAGKSFAGALENYPKVFNEIFVSLVAAGEASGTLDKALERIATQQEKDAEIVRKVKGAMIYPLIVLAVMIGVLVFMLVSVLPQIETLYAGVPNAKLPFITVALLAVSHFIISSWWIVLLGIAILAFFSGRWFKTLGGKRTVDKFKMKAWPIGPLFMKVYMARFARTGTTLVSSGVPLLQMLQITSRAVDNTQITDSLNKASEKVKGGKALSEAIANDPNFLELVPNMIRIGEQSGALEDMLDKVATYYEKEVDDQIKNISTIIEPVMMIIMGVMAITIVSAILLPVYSLVSKSSFGGG